MILRESSFSYKVRLFYQINSQIILIALFLILLSFQLIFWKKTADFRIREDILPKVPSKYLISATSFGDSQFLFRVLATRIQNAGDVFAGFSPLKNYDYSVLQDWMLLFDELDNKSNLIPSLAANYYSQTQKKSDLVYIVDYLDWHASRDIDKKWWWMFQASFIAKSGLGDLDRSLVLAQKLAKNNAKNAPLWTKELPAFIAEKTGNACLSFKVIQNLIKESESGLRIISPEEMNFLRYFIKHRLQSLKKQNFDPRKC